MMLWSECDGLCNFRLWSVFLPVLIATLQSVTNQDASNWNLDGSSYVSLASWLAHYFVTDFNTTLIGQPESEYMSRMIRKLASVG